MTAARTIALSVEIGLRIIGIWPNAPYALLCRCVWILTVGIIQTCQYWYIIVRFGTDDMSQMMDNLSVAMEYTVMSVKLIILWLNSRVNSRSIFYDVLATMAADWREVAVGDVRTMTNKANLSWHISNLMIGIHSAAALFYGVGVITSSNIDGDLDDDAISAVKPAREFTLKLQLPDECNETPLYELVSCLEFLHQLTSSAVTGMLISLVVTLILHTSGQIDILCNALTSVSPERDDRLVASIARDLVVKHQRIIAFADKIESIFCYAVLIQFMSSTLMICCLGYMIVTSINGMPDSDSLDSSALIKAILFYMAVTLEAFVFCFSGEYLSAKSKMIGDAAYKSLWYNLRPSDSKLLLLVMLRSQRRLTITVGKIMDLSLERFTSIIKASVSYISVLHAMY